MESEEYPPKKRFEFSTRVRVVLALALLGAMCLGGMLAAILISTQGTHHRDWSPPDDDRYDNGPKATAAVTVAGPADTPTTRPMLTDPEAVAQGLWSRFVQYYNERDADEYTALFTHDCRVLGQGQPTVEGRADYKRNIDVWFASQPGTLTPINVTEVYQFNEDTLYSNAVSQVLVNDTTFAVIKAQAIMKHRDDKWLLWRFMFNFSV